MRSQSTFELTQGLWDVEGEGKTAVGLGKLRDPVFPECKQASTGAGTNRRDFQGAQWEDLMIGNLPSI